MKNKDFDGKIPSGSYWKDILLEIYRFAPNMYGRSNKMPFHIDEHPLAKKMKISGHNLMLGISFLEDMELLRRNVIVKKEGPSISRLELTKKGFEVILDLEKHRDNSILQFLLLIFTGMLVATGSMQFIKDVTDMNPIKVLIIYLVTILTLGVLGFFFILKDFKSIRRFEDNKE